MAVRYLPSERSDATLLHNPRRSRVNPRWVGPTERAGSEGRGVLYAAFGVRETMVFCEESAGSCIPEG